jgi:hypothetical protein
MAAAAVQGASKELALELLGVLPVAVLKAVEWESGRIFTAAAALLQGMLKRCPAEATAMFLRIHKVFPRYSHPDVDSLLRSFSLMTWTDFVIYGTPEHIAQYRKQVVDDLRRMVKEEPAEDVRIVAFSCCAAFFAQVSEYGVDHVLKLFWSVIKNDRLSETVREAALSGFSQLLLKDLTEINFPARTQQLLSQLPLRRMSDVSGHVYNNVYEMALFCARDPELLSFITAYSASIKVAIEQKLVSSNFIAALREKIDSAAFGLPDAIRELLLLCHL